MSHNLRRLPSRFTVRHTSSNKPTCGLDLEKEENEARSTAVAKAEDEACPVIVAKMVYTAGSDAQV